MDSQFLLGVEESFSRHGCFQVKCLDLYCSGNCYVPMSGEVPLMKERKCDRDG